MKILTFIKPIRTNILYPDERRAESFSINPYDLRAIGRLSLFKTRADIELVCASMGPADSSCVLQRAIASGFHSAYLFCDEAFDDADTIATSYVLSVGARKIGADVIVMGERAADGQTGQTSYGLAERLGLSCVSDVEDIIGIEGDILTLRCKMPEGYKIVRTGSPVVLVFHGLSILRSLFTLIELERARAKGITIWSADDLDADRNYCGAIGSRISVVDIKDDLIKKEGEIIQAMPTKAASKILELLYGKDLCH